MTAVPARGAGQHRGRGGASAVPRWNGARAHARHGAARTVILSALVFFLGCRAGGREEAGLPGTSAAAGESASAAIGAPDTLSFPVVVTFHGDSLGIVASSTPAEIRSALERAVERLRQTASFEVLAISTPVLAVRVRAVRPGTAPALADSLRRHPIVASAEVDALMRPGR